MTTPRMFALFAAVLITAGLFRAFAYGLTDPQHPVDGTSVTSHAAADRGEAPTLAIELYRFRRTFHVIVNAGPYPVRRN